MSAGPRASAGAIAWMVLSLSAVSHFLHGSWAHALLTFAALVLVPLLLDVVRVDQADTVHSRKLVRWALWLQLPAALLLAIAFRREPGVFATLLAAPWAAVLLLIAAVGAMRAIRRGGGSMPTLCGDAGLMFAAVGAAWLLADRSGLRPLGFSEDMVLLTAVHFHYAGLILPVLASKALRHLSQRGVASLIAGGVIAGVPAVAIGITLSQLQVGGGIELAAAILMATSGAAVGVVHLVLGLQPRWPVTVRCLWGAAGISLVAGMALAALYGVRGMFTPWPWLDIPWMRALHGSVNAIGFGLCGTLAWWHFDRHATGSRESS